MSLHRSLQARRAVLAAAVSLAFVDISPAQVSPAPEPFPALRDGHLVPSAEGEVHHTADALTNDVAQAANEWCTNQSLYPGCSLKDHAEREIRGIEGKQSAYSKLDITLELTNTQGQISEHVIDGGLVLVRSCPVDAILITDSGTYLDNRERSTGRRAVACVSPDALPKPDSLGVPEENGANRCPIGNTPLVGNPINPLTGSKIEQVTDYAGPASSGLAFTRTYHSGTFPLSDIPMTIGARYPAGARIGARWRHSFDRVFVRRPHYDANGNVYGSALYLLHEDGRETRFVKQGNMFVPGDGERGSLREHPEGGWVYTWTDLTEERYDDRGRLRSRTDANGNTMLLHYDEITVGIGLKATVLVRVSDRQGRELRLGYDRLGRLETVDTPDGRINYSYSGDLLEGLDADLVKVRYPDGHHVEYLYDEPDMGGTPNHKLTGIVGKDGQRFATFNYDSNNRAIRSTHGNGVAWTEIDMAGGAIDVYRGDTIVGQTLVPTYDSGRIRLGGRSEFAQSGEVRQTFDYLGGGLVTRQTDYLRVPTIYRYDTTRRLETERTEAEGTPVARTVKTTWHPRFDKPTRIDDGAQWTVFTYDDKGNLTERRDGGLADAGVPGSEPWPEERVTSYTYDSAARLVSIDGPLPGAGDTTRFAYRDADAPGCASGGVCTWRRGDLHAVTSALGHVNTVLAYDASGRVLASTDANGVRSDRRYDAMGRITEVAVRARRDGVPSDDDAITRLTYTANGDIDTLTDPDLAVVHHRYDSAHRLIEQTDGLGRRHAFEMNSADQLIKETYLGEDGGIQFERTYTYDMRGLPRSAYTPASGTRYYSYDANRRFLGSHGVGAYREDYQRDALGRVESAHNGDAASATRITYDGSGHPKTVVDPKGLSTEFLRNGLGDLLWQRSPDTGEKRFDNDPNGRPVNDVPADGRHVQRDYDALGRLTKLTFREGRPTTYAYDQASPLCGTEETYAIGRLAVVDEASGSTAFCYDFAGRVVRKSQIAQGVRLDLRYTYSRAGRLTGITYPDGRHVSYTRSKTGDITRISAQQGGSTAQPLITEAKHNALGKTIGWVAGTRTFQRLQDTSGNLAEISDQRADGLHVKYGYLGGFIWTIDTGGAPGPLTIDSASRITNSTLIDFSEEGDLPFSHTYTYDATGNRTKWATLLPSADRPYVYASDSHHLIAAGAVSREYDAVGNTTQIGDREFVYDATGRMSQAKVNGVVEMNYAYNAFGQQVAKFIAGQTTISLHDEAGHWLGDYDSAGRAIRQVVWLDDLPVVVFDGDTIRDIQADHLGTPRVIIDRASDKAIWKWSIAGEAFGSTPPNEDPDGDGNKYFFEMRFPGQRYDAVTGLFQNGWRDYDPQSGRYIQSDPIGLAGGISTYAYVANNPYLRVDPLGLANFLIGGSLTFIAAGGGGVGGGLYFSYTKDQGFDMGLYGSVSGGIGADIGASVNVGYVPGGASNISGTSLDGSISAGAFSGTVGGAINNPSYASYSAGVGIGLPGGASLSVTKTGHAGVQDGFWWLRRVFNSAPDCATPGSRLEKPIAEMSYPGLW